MIVKTRIMGISCFVFRFIGEISRFLSDKDQSLVNFMCFSAGQFQKYIYQRQYTKASSVLTVGHKFHHIIQRTPQCFADLSHGFNRDVFISGHLENDLVADTLGLFKIFLFHIPVDQQFPKLFIAYIYTVSLNSIRIYSKNRNSWSWLLRI